MPPEHLTNLQLYKNPETQYGTKILKYVNRIEGEYGDQYAFGSQSKTSSLRQTEGYQIPPEVGNRNEAIRDVINKGELTTTPSLSLESTAEKFEVFLKAWERVKKSQLNPQDIGFRGYSNFSQYREKKGLERLDEFVLKILPEKVSDDLMQRQIEPQAEFWKKYLNRIDNIRQANELFKADITRFEPFEYHPIFCFGASKKTPLLDVFQTAKVLNEARKENETRIEKLLSKLS
jgi:hypothetical protein